MMRTISYSHRDRSAALSEWTDFRHTNCCPCHTTRQIAYSVEEAAARVGSSAAVLRAQIRHGYLVARYVNTKVLIEHEELVAWLQHLPSESPTERAGR